MVIRGSVVVWWLLSAAKGRVVSVGTAAMVYARSLMVMRSEWFVVVEACGGLCDGGLGLQSLKVVCGEARLLWRWKRVVCGVVLV